MTLKDTASTLIKWAESSTTLEQLELLDSLIDRFLINRFRGDISLASEVAKVLIALQGQSKIVAKEPMPETTMN